MTLKLYIGNRKLRKFSRKTDKLWHKLFRPNCYGWNVKCPYLFTEKQYACPSYPECKIETLAEFKRRLKEGESIL